MPERRTRKPLKEISNENISTAATSPESPPGSHLFQSLSFLFDELKLLNYSGNSDNKEQIVSTSNSFEKAVNDLFIEENEELHVG